MKISTWIFAIKVFPEDTTLITDDQELVLPFKTETCPSEGSMQIFQTKH